MCKRFNACIFYGSLIGLRMCLCKRNAKNSAFRTLCVYVLVFNELNVNKNHNSAEHVNVQVHGLYFPEQLIVQKEHKNPLVGESFNS